MEGASTWAVVQLGDERIRDGSVREPGDRGGAVPRDFDGQPVLAQHVREPSAGA